jgi:GNAT superfamily N-acetyltransferase
MPEPDISHEQDGGLTGLTRAALTHLKSREHVALGTEIVLGDLHRGHGWNIAVALQRTEVTGVSVVTPQRHWYLHAMNGPVALTMLALTICREVPLKVTASAQVGAWVRDGIERSTGIMREHSLLTMTCAEPINYADGRWATSDDIETLDRYQNDYNRERGTDLHPRWRDLVARHQVAVLERDGKLVSVVGRSGMSARYARLGSNYTIPTHRGQGLAGRVTAFLVNALLEERPKVSLTVDEDNVSALRLYGRLGFQEAGQCYMAYPGSRTPA